MTAYEIILLAEEYIRKSPKNYVSDDAALCQSLVGMRIFNEPIFAFGCPDDEIYLKYKRRDVIGDGFLLPAQWLEGAKTVVSFFLPYSQKIRRANAVDFEWPADEWLHARYEGQLLLKEFAAHLQDVFVQAGAKSVVPSYDARFKTGDARDKSGGASERFTSNWSERHAAFAAGLGTFGLSKGLITDKGTCGRFGSILTELDLPKTTRRYADVYEFCNKCGRCVSNCPAGAISFENGKNDLLCSDFLDRTYAKSEPRYGCGKCQVAVACESGVPG